MAEAARQLTPEEEKQAIRDIALAAETHTKVGYTFYLITHRFSVLTRDDKTDQDTTEAGDKSNNLDLETGLDLPDQKDNNESSKQDATSSSTIGIDARKSK